MKSAIMIVTCLIVLVSQTGILMMFLKRLKKIEVAFWGEAAEKARQDIDTARKVEQKKLAREAAEKK